MPTAKAVGIHERGYEPILGVEYISADADLKNSIDLGFKDTRHYPEDSRGHYKCCTSRDMYSGYGPVAAPTQMQQRVIDAATQALNSNGSKWNFRQLRDVLRPDTRLGVVRRIGGYLSNFQKVAGDLKKCPSDYPLVFVYQRDTDLPLDEEFAWGASELELGRLTQAMVVASDEITDLVSPRYTFTGVEVKYDHHDDWGRPGEGADDPRLILAALTFSDRVEELHFLKERRRQARVRLTGLGRRISELEAALKN